MRHIFFIYHPVVIFTYIAGAIVCAMLTTHPVFVALSFCCASMYSIYLNGARTYLRGLRYTAFIFLVIALFNPLFNHKGFTVLFYIGSNPITWEALLYGLCTGGVLAAIIVWFQCYQKLVTNDRFLYLFGRVAPTAAMLVSMVLKWIPVTAQKARAIKTAHLALEGNTTKSKRQQLKDGIRQTGILMSWSMEDGIETADSMRARGYGMGRRTFFSSYSFGTHDAISLGILLLLLGTNLFLLITRANNIMFYPLLAQAALPVYCYIPYVCMLCYPLLLQGKERIKCL